MKKVTLFLAVLIFAASLTSCYDDDYFAPLDRVATIALFPPALFIWALNGKVSQEIPDVTAPEVYKFNEDFNVKLNENVLTIESSFVEGGQLHLEAVKSEEGSNWIVKDANIESSKALNKRFELDQNDPTNIAIQNLNTLTNEINLSFDIVIQDLLEQVSIPMKVTFEGTYKSN